MRLRTLPLSLSGIIMGVGIAAAGPGIRFGSTFFLVLTTVCLQVLVNLSNELGDTLSGTDTQERQGIHYSLQDGIMTVGEMRKLIMLFVLLSCIFGALMIYCCFGTLFALRPLAFLVLGAIAIYAAIHYTLGKNPYGYRGLGDISVFVFFGLATVLGGYVLSSGGQIPPASALLPTLAIGLFSVAVLNVNNIRDMRTDAATRKTVALELGERGARIYHTLLIALGWLAMLVYSCLGGLRLGHFLWVLSLPLYLKHLRGVWTLPEGRLDPMLPLLVKSPFLLSILSVLGFLL